MTTAEKAQFAYGILLIFVALAVCVGAIFSGRNSK